jgi:carbonic anhydrase
MPTTRSSSKVSARRLCQEMGLRTTFRLLIVGLFLLPTVSMSSSSSSNSKGINRQMSSSSSPGDVVLPDKSALRMIQDHEEKDPAIERLFEMNRAWVQRTNEQDPDFFPTLGKGQSPDYLYIGCSDSRVAISDLMGIEMGELFVHRNIANMVISSDLNLLSVLTYAVHFLKVKHILVTGHYDCGGVRAAVQKLGRGQVLDAWLQNIRDVYRLHKKELDGIADEEARHRRLVELNVSEQCLNLYKTSIVQSRRLQTYNDDAEPFTTPRIHGLVFDPATGILSEVPIDFRRRIDELKDMYDLFDLDKYEASYLLQRDNAPQDTVPEESSKEKTGFVAKFLKGLLQRLP